MRSTLSTLVVIAALCCALAAAKHHKPIPEDAMISEDGDGPFTPEDFHGTYADPNHHECYRKIAMFEGEKFGAIIGVDQKDGVTECDGKDDKFWGPFHIKVLQTNKVQVDLSGKGGPSDLTGTFVKHHDGSEWIKWSDGNSWYKMAVHPGAAIMKSESQEL